MLEILSNNDINLYFNFYFCQQKKNPTMLKTYFADFFGGKIQL